MKISVALSGGVDSAVATKLLIDKGFDVSCVFLRLNDNIGSEKKAKRIAQKLNVSLKVLDLRKEFQKKIIDKFLEDFKKGITPNPCVECNKEIKFEMVLGKNIATGHYVRKKGEELFKAKDLQKDQSYFLWRLTKNQIKKSFFPLGDYTKAEVRKKAKDMGLDFSKEEESQEVCFITGKTVDFLKKHIKTKKGKILDENDNVIGEHEGVWFYTIGQRKGMDLPGGPFFVFDKDFKKNILYVSKNRKLLKKKEVSFSNPNWIVKTKFPFRAKAKIRYRAKEEYVTVFSNKAVLDKYIEAVTPGQSIVFYKNKKLLGGAVIR